MTNRVAALILVLVFGLLLAGGMYGIHQEEGGFSWESK